MLRVPVLVISGPVGVGKSTVANEVSAVLSARDVPHTVVDLDALAATFPAPRDDPFQQRLALRNLAALWVNAREAGSRNLVVPRVVEHHAEVADYAAAVPGAEVIVARLTADDADLLDRVERRMLGAGRKWHRDRALELARLLAEGPGDVVVATSGRHPTDVAAELVEVVDWVEAG